MEIPASENIKIPKPSQSPDTHLSDSREASTTDLTTKEGVVNLMASAISEADWNAKCDEVKKANGGYPDFWFPSIVLSGLVAKVSSRF